MSATARAAAAITWPQSSEGLTRSFAFLSVDINDNKGKDDD